VDRGLPQYLTGPKELIIKVVIMQALPDGLADYFTTAIMLDEFCIVNILQGGLVFHCDDLLEVCVDYLLWRLGLAQLLGKFGSDSTGSSVEDVEVVLLETILKIFHKDIALLVVALELRGNKTRRLIRTVNFDWICTFMDDGAEGRSGL
jgi:hypothetical protein